MFNLFKKKNAKEFVLSDISHELRTPLVAIRSSLNCTKEILPKLIEAYEAALSNGLVEKSLEYKFLEKVYLSVENAINETVFANYYLDKMRDTLMSSISTIAKIDRISMYDVIWMAVNFHESRINGANKKIKVSDNIKNVIFLTEKRVIDRAFLYLIDNLIIISLANEKSFISVDMVNKFGKKIVSFGISNIDKDLMLTRDMFYGLKFSANKKIGYGMSYFKDFVNKSGWNIHVSILDSIIKIDIVIPKLGDINV